MWLDWKSCEDFKNTVGPGLLEGFSSAGQIHRACWNSRAAFQQRGLEVVPWKSCVQYKRCFLSETSELSSQLPSFPCSEPLEAVSAADPSRWGRMVLSHFVSGCQPGRAGRKGAVRAGLKGSLSCCCFKKKLCLNIY